MTNHSYSPSFRLESGFPLVPRLYSNLVVPTPQINFSEDNGTTQLIQHVIQAWNWKLVFYYDFVHRPTIDTHSPTTIFFWGE
jgi:hypothetical protein